jgi:uncharacterized OsmC-like protein
MLIEEENLARMREHAMAMRTRIKQGAPDEEFMNNITVTAEQVQSLHARLHVGYQDLEVDEPSENGGDGSAPTPVEMLLSAVAGCTELTWITFCTVAGLAVEKIEVNVEGSLDRRYFAVPSIPARLQSVKIISRVYTNEPEEKVGQVHEKIKSLCPVAGSLNADIEKEHVLEVLPAND